MAHKQIDYNIQADLYENTRKVFPLVYSTLCCLLRPAKGELVLDFGCGTGNYLVQFVSEYGIEPYGIEPSESMRKIAQSKLPAAHIQDGNHSKLPFTDKLFSKIYTTDVIHHIQQLDTLFINLLQVAAPQARFCVCTESPHQLGEKFWISYFPDVLAVDLQRFHPIDEIITAGEEAGWIHVETLTTEDELIAPISSDFMKCVEEKTISAFRLISQSAYDYGYSLLNADYQARKPLQQHEGYTYILFERKC